MAETDKYPGEGSLNKYYSNPKNRKAMEKAFEEYRSKKEEEKYSGEGKILKRKKGKAAQQAEALEK